jgi:hypothetical protein
LAEEEVSVVGVGEGDEVADDGARVAIDEVFAQNRNIILNCKFENRTQLREIPALQRLILGSTKDCTFASKISKMKTTCH